MATRDTEDRHAAGTYIKRPIALARGLGVRVWDEDGREYIDCTSGIGVAALGHAHPVVLDAIGAQSDRLITCHELFYNDARAALLDVLDEITPPGLGRFFLSNSGTEANEAALKFARVSTGRTGIVAAMRGYHGKTMGSLSATWDRTFRDPFEPLVPGVAFMRYDDAGDAEATIADSTAAVIVEVVQGEGGVRPATLEFLATVRRLCTERGALLIVDEVQTGFGRTGRMFACEHHDLVPDILTMAKAAGGGLPIGITALGPAVVRLQPQSHTTTFGGNPLVCAVAGAVIRHIVEHRVAEHAAETGAYFLDALRRLPGSRVREVRGLGLMIGIELKEPAGPYAQRVMDEGVLVLLAGRTVLRLLPPLIIERADVDLVVERLARVLS
jgi:acetylornithine/LysW-gamma-L-lysine aminotransferase